MLPVPVDSSSTIRRTFLFTDIVGSTALKERLGNTAGRKLIAQHDAAFHECLAVFPHAKFQDEGDGFFVVFDEPAQAIGFALRFQSSLGRIRDPEPCLCRIGIHAGAVLPLERESAEGSDSKYVGLAIDLAARVRGLAAGRQILLTRGVFETARDGKIPGFEDSELLWLAHGGYLFKGISEPVEVFEVGVAGLSLLARPEGSGAAKQTSQAVEEGVLGWRPSAGSTPPNRRDVRLEKRIGRGGFGEAWLGRDNKTGAVSVFKFCFEAAKLRSLRREQTVLRFIHESLGERPDIARLRTIELEKPPFYLELEYVSGGDLGAWSAAQGGLSAVPLETRLEIVAQVADAVAAGHSVGVIHKDLKPGNVLVKDSEAGAPPRVVLTDFGIAAVEDIGAIDRAGVTAAGFTVPLSQMTRSGSFESGTRIYMAPELVMGQRATLQSDIYSLGVLLYQMVVADFSRPIAVGWERQVDDELLREDIASCVAGSPQDRPAGAALVAERIRRLPKRRAEAEARREDERRRVLAQRRRNALAVAAAVAFVLGVLASIIAVFEYRRAGEERDLRRVADSARDEAEYERFVTLMRTIPGAIQSGNFDEARRDLLSIPPRFIGWNWGYYLRMVHPEILTLREHEAGLRGGWFSPDDRLIVTIANDGVAALWDVATGNRLHWLRGHTGKIHHASFSPDSGLVATASEDGDARVWNDRGELLFTLAGHEASVNKVKFSPDGKLIVTCSDDHTARVWSAETGELVHLLNGHEDWIFNFDFSPDSNRVATCSDDDTAKVWDCMTGEEVFTIRGHSGDVNAIDFSPDGAHLLTGSSDASAKIWDAATGSLLRELEQVGAPVSKAFYSEHGDRIMVIAERRVKVYDSATGETRIDQSGSLNTEIVDGCFHSGGLQIFVADRTHRICRWNGSEVTPNFSGNHEDTIASVSSSHDGRLILTASADGTAKVIPVAGFHAMYVETEFIPTFAWSSDSGVLAYADFQQQIHLLTFPSGKKARVWPAHSGRIRAISISPTQPLLVTGSEDKTAIVWDYNEPKALITVAGHQDVVRSVQFSPTGDELLTGSQDNTAAVWHARTGEELLRIAGHKQWVITARYSPDGANILTTSRDGSAALWERTSGRELHRWEFAGKEVMAGEFAPDGSWCALGFNTGTITIVNTATKEVAREISLYKAPIQNLSISPDGVRLGVAGSSENAKVVDPRTGRQFHAFTPAQYTGFSPDGRTFALAVQTRLSVIDSIPYAELEPWGDDAAQFRRSLWEWQKRTYPESLIRSRVSTENE